MMNIEPFLPLYWAVLGPKSVKIVDFGPKTLLMTKNEL